MREAVIMSSLSNSQLYERLGVSPAELQEFCERSPITELAFFGSVLREDFNADSDIDVLVSLTPEPSIDLFDFFDLEEQFKNLFQRDVDLLDRETVESDKNWIRRRGILNHIQIIYRVGRFAEVQHAGLKPCRTTGKVTRGSRMHPESAK